MSKIEVSPGPLDTPCWVWTGSLNNRGYGGLNVMGKDTLAHRVSWALNVGPVPPGMFVCHRCDVRRCVCPSHLFLGTNQENMADAGRKGRCAATRHPHTVRGSNNANAVLNEDYVRDARAVGKSCRQVMDETGLSKSPAWAMLTRRTWKHVL